MIQAKIQKHVLSKSTFMYGCQCPRRLWLHKFMPQVRDEEDEEQSAILQRGTDVGLLAQQLFPNGADASPADPYHYQESVAATARYIREGHTIIYEAAFQYDGILCAVDMLVKKNNLWYAYEVKSTCRVKDPHVQDAALQYYVITHAGLELQDIFIVHLNNQYVRQGKLDITRLFTRVSVLDDVKAWQHFIYKKAKELRQVLHLKTEPEVIVSGHCNKPYPCDFQSYCNRDFEEITIDYGKPSVNKIAIREFIGELQYPLYFMDFETWSAAVPECDGHWSYRQVPFQFSVHVQQKPAGLLSHHYYLADGPQSSGEGFIISLLNVLGTEGSIVVYNQSFEKSRLRELKAEFPAYAEYVSAIEERITDLMAPFRKDYRVPAMHGSYSIKAVLPALVPGLSYAGLAINNGGDASAAFYNLKHETDVEKIREVRLALLEYCGLDTLAMVKILEKLMKV